MTTTIIQALPGWQMVYFDLHNKVCYFEPIVAWCIEETKEEDAPMYFTVTPLTLEGSGEKGDDFSAVMRPDGVIEITYERSFKAVSELTAYWKKKLIEREA